MSDVCPACGKVTQFLPVSPRLTARSITRQTIRGLWHCPECHTVIFYGEPITEEEKKAALERAELLEGFD